VSIQQHAPQPTTTVNPRLRRLLLTVRQAMLMIVGGIEEYLDLPNRKGITHYE
jgi:hypothetical protein